jgi:hypothetical protein
VRAVWCLGASILALGVVTAGCARSALDSGNAMMCPSAALASTTLPHRPQPVACPRSARDPAEVPVATCAVDADCGAFPLRCLQHECTADGCLADDDCAATDACVCARDDGSSNIVRLNRCVPSGCRVDADCGADGLCAPAHGYCGSSVGYHCRSTDDECCTSSDCVGSSCEYAPAVGHWQCMTLACLG